MKHQPEPLVIRAMSYNIHGCVDANRQIQPLNVLRVIEQLGVDIIALQEVDWVAPSRLDRNQADFIGEKLRQNHICFPTDEKGLHAFGLAVISRFKIAAAYFDWLPNLSEKINLRKRAALRVTLDTPAGNLHIVNTHLSIYRLEGRKQARALLAGSWLEDIPADEPVILCGDFNAGPASITYRMFSRQYTDVQKAVNNGQKPKPTFHSRSTLWRIDHIFVSPQFTALNVEVPRNVDTQSASDHLPLAVELAMTASGMQTRAAGSTPAGALLN